MRILITMTSATETPKLQVGDIAPDFTLKTNNGEEWRLSSFRHQKNVVLAFVPFAFSRVCSIQLPSYEGDLERFRDQNTEVVSISMDSTHALNAWAESIKTSFPLLSDFYPQGKVVDAYGLRHPAVGTSNRAVVLVDKEGIVRFIEVTEKLGDLPDNDKLFAALKKL